MPYDGDRSDDKAVVPTGWRGSTNLNSTIKSYEDLAYRVKAQLGFPVTDLEVTDEQIAIYVDEALEWYTLYSGTERKWLIFRDHHYVEGCGVKLDDIVRHVSIKSECFNTTSAVEVTATNYAYDFIPSSNVSNTVNAYLSVSPFQFPSTTDDSLSAQGQNVILKYDKSNPWDSFAICNADCFTVRPQNSDCNSLSSNSNLDNIDFTDLITTYPDLSGLLDHPTVTADGDGIIPISGLECDILSTIPTEYFDTSAFYASADLVGFPVTACIEIKDGQGVIYASCDKDSIDCDPLSAAWTIDPDFDWSVENGTVSGEDGRVIPFSGLDLSSANSVSIPGLPSCNLNGIPLDENSGYYATFFVCNSALDTNGPWEVENVQFLKSYAPPEDALNERFCSVDNKGFTILKSISAHEDCIPSTPDWVPVDVVFEDLETTDLTGCVVSTTSGGYDESLNYRRKVSNVFSMDYTMGNGGYWGGNLLFSFETGIVANAFGFDLQGNRSLARNGYDMLSYELARGFIDQVQRMVNYASYEFNPDTQYLKIIPEPYPETRNSNQGRSYIIGAHVEKPIEHLINKKWVQEWVRARVMESVGFIRSKFGNVTLFGGASIAGDSLVSMGKEETERLLRELRDDHYYTEPSLFFVG